MSEKHLIYSSFPPSHCGVGTYAAEHLAALKEQGFTVFTVSPLTDSEADFHVDLTKAGSLLKWIYFCLTRSHDVVHVHYVDNYLFPRNPGFILLRFLLLILQFFAIFILCHRSIFAISIIHEFNTKINPNSLFSVIRSIALSRSDEIHFHTASVMMDCRNSYSLLKNVVCKVIDHSRFMTKRYHGTGQEARERLNLSLKKRVFLCLGFLQASKGFQDAISAFSMAQISNVADLHIVGSAKEDCEISMNFLHQLQHQCLSTNGVLLHKQFLTDEEFDCWLMAANVIILPYMGVASSGVGARAGLYNKKIIIRNIPNLREQFPNAEFFSSVEELASLLILSQTIQNPSVVK